MILKAPRRTGQNIAQFFPFGGTLAGWYSPPCLTGLSRKTQIRHVRVLNFVFVWLVASYALWVPPVNLIEKLNAQMGQNKITNSNIEIRNNI
ncbi:hypothetical protein A2160_01835 [Candidatus Beckwithbacteria bacterium RBG_13_42_9]|uniref:Uncharacterized protein n=1 Tax=Candidatus Beckwithbacteria bacterium RBG_13_42_9 TaxID=1797457 RepID=A0A1F5E8E7_9BACT|nr:MAG: hypothetical protein A2160_01835 [Candidatus Beckwithbacteria bacterium RBG_13_42_9]